MDGLPASGVVDEPSAGGGGGGLSGSGLTVTTTVSVPAGAPAPLGSAPVTAPSGLLPVAAGLPLSSA